VSPAAACPHPEEFSALLDRQLAPEEIPTLERHVGECENCRKLFLRLAATDRMLGLVIGKVDLVNECLEVKPEKQDAPSEKLLEEIEAMGRTERVTHLREKEEHTASRRGRRKLVLFLLVLLLIGAFAGSLQPSPVSELKGASRQGAYVVGPGEVVLCRGTRVTLSDDAKARFWCAFRWDRPTVELKQGKLSVLEGKLLIKVGNEIQEIDAGKSGEVGPDGKLLFAAEKPPAGSPSPDATPESPPAPASD
jgi:hypothetical protein